MLAERGMAPGLLIVAHSRVRVGRVLNRNLPETIMVVLVIDTGGKALGVLTERILIEAMLNQGPMTTLGDLLRADEDLEDKPG
jgi:CBS domain-containing protein